MRAAAAACLLWALVATQCGAQFKSRRVNNPDIPASSFSCVGRHNGYYADVETDCQVYHMCLDRQQFSYQCPNTTRFQQRMMICDHWYQVDCPSAPLSYSANLLIGQRDTPFVGDEEHRVLQEENVRTSKGLLKRLSQPAANTLGGSDAGQKPSPTFAPFPRTSASTTARPFVAPPPSPSSALEAPFEDEPPQRASFFQRSPTSSFAQPFQNQLQQQRQQQRQASTAAPVSFTFTPTSTPAPPRFSISFSPSPSFPASGHNLQRAPSPPPSAPSPSPSPFPSPSPSPTVPSSTFAATSAFAPSAFSSSAFAPSAFAPSSLGPSAFSPSAPAPSPFAPIVPTVASPSPSPSVRPPSRELEAPFDDYPEPEGNALPSGPATGLPATAFPSPSAPSAPSAPLFAPSTGAPPAESMTPQQTASFAAPFPRGAVAPPSRELTPPHYFGSDAPGPLSSHSVAASFAPGSATGFSVAGPSATAVSAPSASGSGSFPRPFSSANSTQRYSLFAATAAPGTAPGTAPGIGGSTPAPPSRELEAPVDEGEVDYNTVELKFQDRRRLFFIPTGDSGSSSSSSSGGDASDPVVVIKYPSKSTRNANGVGSTALLKSYPEDVKRRVDPKCPHCHPDFVVPGTCSPCVLLR